ncbi:hypothetical protein QBC38DRAFT_364702 [Podospora fimiseda]|uniref:Mitochondrial integral membrane protein n=1 Tax=Podospora fimiseda TaxID=252190 RepID=A0AAN7BQE2_9PEZI|nr:hypothetical protein QBC38DRAFT_364702 [Podospora fimiseda]
MANYTRHKPSWSASPLPNESSSSLSPPPPDLHDANEHTRLLPNRIDSTNVPPGYLDPSDPAVSPYNLFTVRLLRGLTVVFTIFTFIWWVLLLVSAFVTPPGLHVRAGPFYSFAYTSVSLLTLVVLLLFFAVPSKSARILSFVTGGVLLIDVIIILAASRIRHEEGAVGIVSVVWALLVAVWAGVAGRTVKWGKAEEEERLTGRPETRRSVLEWSEVLLSTIALGAIAVVVILMTLTLTLRAIDSGVGPPGERYWVDEYKYQIHLYCQGQATDAEGKRTTTVLIEGGEDPVERGLWQLAEGAIKNGSISRFCFADRPGMAWSDTAPSPLSASMASDVLGETLSRAGETGPWVLVSAGVGSLYSRVFSSRHGKEVKGILMIDPLHEDLLGRVASPGRGFWLWVRGVISPCGFDRILGALLRGRRSADRIWGRASYQSGSTIFAKLQESLVADSLTKRDVASSRAIQDKNTAVVIISSGKQIRKDSEWEDKQRDLSHLTRKLEDWDIVEDAPHRVWDDFKGRELIEKRLRRLVG